MEGGREFQIDDPENTRLILKFFELNLLVDLMKSERMYSGVSPLDTINIITALLYFSCFVNWRSLSFQFVICGNRQIRKDEFICETMKKILLFFVLLFVCWWWWW